VAESTGPLLDRYEVIRVLGTESSARTLLCSDLTDGRRVAVKELHFRHAESWKHPELFEREASVLSKLDHPGIPKVHDFSPARDDATTLYIVQDFIEGTSLHERMASGPLLGRPEVVDLATGMLDVLEYLHGRVPPVLHRDIKPSNILLRPAGPPVLVDFGGVLFGWRPPGAVGTTVVGTFGYMPPEQLVGQAGPTSDLYALGATLLHVVTGTPLGRPICGRGSTTTSSAMACSPGEWFAPSTRTAWRPTTSTSSMSAIPRTWPSVPVGSPPTPTPSAGGGDLAPGGHLADAVENSSTIQRVASAAGSPRLSS